MNKIKTCLIFIFLITTIALQAQDNERISDSFVNVSLEEFFSRLEKKVPYKFYYNAKDLKNSLFVTGSKRSYTHANTAGSF